MELESGGAATKKEGAFHANAYQIREPSLTFCQHLAYYP